MFMLFKHGRRIPINDGKYLQASPVRRLHVRIYQRESPRRIFMKFNIGDFHEDMQTHSNLFTIRQ